MTFEEWLKIGMDNGWCSQTLCVAHDMPPLTDEEEEDWHIGNDPCVYCVRVYQDIEEAKSANKNFKPVCTTKKGNK